MGRAARKPPQNISFLGIRSETGCQTIWENKLLRHLPRHLQTCNPSKCLRPQLESDLPSARPAAPKKKSQKSTLSSHFLHFPIDNC